MHYQCLVPTLVTVNLCISSSCTTDWQSQHTYIVVFGSHFLLQSNESLDPPCVWKTCYQGDGCLKVSTNSNSTTCYIPPLFLSASGLMDALFNQHFSIGSNYPNPGGLRAPSPPPPQPINLQSKTNHGFPETGGNFAILLVIYAIASLRSSLKSP